MPAHAQVTLRPSSKHMTMKISQKFDCQIISGWPLNNVFTFESDLKSYNSIKEIHFGLSPKITQVMLLFWADDCLPIRNLSPYAETH